MILGVAPWTPGQEPKLELPVRGPIEHQSKHGGRVVVADDKEVTRMRVQRDASMPKFGMNHTRFVFLVFVNPQLDGGITLFHVYILRSSAIGRVSRVWLWLRETRAQVCETFQRRVYEHHRIVERIGERRAHLETTSSQITTTRKGEGPASSR